MLLSLTPAALAWFEERNISFHNRFGVRLQPGDYIYFNAGLEVEPYIGVHAGNVICALGFMSFTNSALPPDLTVGRYCSLGAGLSFPRYRHPVEHVSTSSFTHDPETDIVVRAVRDRKPGYANFFPNAQRGPVVIEHDVWIGQDATIMPGLTLGTGSVVAANSVVTRSVQPYEIVGGNPARPIRMRFEPGVIAGLLASRWWEYHFTDFDGLDLAQPAAFLRRFDEVKAGLQPYRPAKIALSGVAPLCTVAG
jgi:acetyltransferase-like isoleucine patch superfamily enzyme